MHISTIKIGTSNKIDASRLRWTLYESRFALTPARVSTKRPLFSGPFFSHAPIVAGPRTSALQQGIPICERMPCMHSSIFFKAYQTRRTSAALMKTLLRLKFPRIGCLRSSNIACLRTVELENPISNSNNDISCVLNENVYITRASDEVTSN